MSRDPRAYRIIVTTPLAELPLGIATCLWCKNPVYEPRRYGRDPGLREDAKRGWITFAETMHVVTGPDGERSVCGACVKRLAIGDGSQDVDDPDGLRPWREA